MADIKHKLLWKSAGSIIRMVNYVTYSLQHDDGKVIRFNTAENTDNLGDYIIMKYCGDVLNELYHECEFIDIPTHCLPLHEQEEQVKKTKQKFVCGTNILTSNVEVHWNWCLPEGLRRKLDYRNVILLGAGWKNYEGECSEYTEMIYKSMLNPVVIHSVRDQYTEKMLKKAGIPNVVNTGCPTMWRLTPEFCQNIPRKKARNVITTITDYRQNVDNDSQMLKILGRNYEQVYLWLQGKHDKEYLETLSVPSNLVPIAGGLDIYEQYLERGNIDYIGTRLHAGIFALNYCIRSLIIAVDNRAVEIARDTNLPILDRNDLSQCLESLIQCEWKTKIHINQKNIDLFKAQFRREKDSQYGQA